MELTLDSQDLRPQHRNLNASQIKFEHFNFSAQQAITIVGRGLYQTNGGLNHQAISPPAKPGLQEYPPISYGTKVRTTHSHTKDHEWSKETRESRRWGVEGTAIGHHDGHGLCYDVRHSDDDSVSSYDPTELEIIP